MHPNAPCLCLSWKDLAIFDRLANHAAARFDGVGGGNYPADLLQAVKDRDQVFGMAKIRLNPIASLIFCQFLKI